MSKDSVIRILIVVIVLYTSLLIVLIIYFAMQAAAFTGVRITYENPIQTTTDTTQTPVSSPTITNTLTTTPSNSLTYTDPTYNFEIQYPSKYRTTEDKSGWANAAVLLYDGGQSYNLAIEVWNSEADYLVKYSSNPLLKYVTIKQVGDKFFTFNNINNTDDIAQVIASFKTTDGSVVINH